MTIVEFVNARLDEEEQAAEAATPGKWGAQPGETGTLDNEWEVVAEGVTHVVYVGHEGGGVTTEENALHIARHDPLRVLREITAKRQAVVEAKQANEFVSERFRLPIENGASGYLLRLIAAPYADHPDYDPAWTLT
ncbi:DUF6221 family protein [Nocardiopsis sp. NPDC006198]|uniref:DUF6221 family protein n=1 Tax=Nocardiopsis sp. NPDC006198 TaxID=3154472 RepID=UPI00339DC769